MKFKVGDKAKIRSDLKCQIYGGVAFVDKMKKYLGNEITISKVHEYGYRSKETDWYNWSDEMLEPATVPAKRDWIMIIRPDKADPDVTVGILKVDGKEVRRETVKRYYKDEYNIASAIGVTAVKMVGRGIRDFEKPPVKEVRRHAEVGEWIKIVNPVATGGHYGFGDIMRVFEKSPVDGFVRASTRDCKYPVSDGEYVVLENYTPK